MFQPSKVSRISSIHSMYWWWTRITKNQLLPGPGGRRCGREWVLHSFGGSWSDPWRNGPKITRKNRNKAPPDVGYGEIRTFWTFVQHFDWRMPSNCGHHPEISLWKTPRSCCWVTSEPWMGTKELAVTYIGLMPWLEHQVEILLEFDSGADQQPAPRIRNFFRVPTEFHVRWLCCERSWSTKMAKNHGLNLNHLKSLEPNQKQRLPLLVRLQKPLFNTFT